MVFYNYIAFLFFAFVGISIPFSMIVISKLLRSRIPSNPVKASPYESAEKPIGSSRDIDNEYMPYFMLFLPFEIVLVILILWSIVASSLDFKLSLSIILITVVSVVFSIIGYKIAGE